MCEKLIEKHLNKMGLHQLTLFAEDSPVKTCHVPENRRDLKEREADYGLKCCGSSEKLSQDGLLLKMFEERLISHLTLAGWDWKNKVTKSGLTSFLLLQQEHHTKEKGCSLLRSPNANDWRNQGHSEQIYLCNQVRPSQVKNENKKNKLWPTATTRDYKGGRKPETLEYVRRNATNSLNDAVNSTIKTTGQLNADWVEILMGYSIGYTDIDCDNPAPWPGWPAGLGAGTWNTPDCSDRRSAKSKQQGLSNQVKYWHTPRANKISGGAGKGFSPTLMDDIKAQTGQFPYEPPRVITGQKNRAKRLKCLGNSVVSQQAYPIFKAIMEVESNDSC